MANRHSVKVWVRVVVRVTVRMRVRMRMREDEVEVSFLFILYIVSWLRSIIALRLSFEPSLTDTPSRCG